MNNERQRLADESAGAGYVIMILDLFQRDSWHRLPAKPDRLIAQAVTSLND
ncbi:MAG: hypothetical protein HY308_03250 [Gammaproteobacteria bacterium]|nr:hypothetical protein [Gammaproteobacteria bacterium]